MDIVLNISREGRGGWSPENNVVIRHAISNRIRRPGNFFAYSQRENCFAYISYVHMRLITSFFFRNFSNFEGKENRSLSPVQQNLLSSLKVLDIVESDFLASKTRTRKGSII